VNDTVLIMKRSI